MNEEYVPLFTEEEIDDMFNAVDVLRHLHLSPNGIRVNSIIEKYAYGTTGYQRAGMLYKKMERLTKLKILSMPEDVLDSMLGVDTINNG